MIRTDSFDGEQIRRAGCAAHVSERLPPGRSIDILEA